MKSAWFALGIATVGAFAALTPQPASAQAFQRYVEVYGNDPCPISSDKEIVVCARKPESDRYRIPEQLRDTNITANERWADRATALEYVGRSGGQSCSTSGNDGWTGCWSKLMRDARAERKQASKNEPDLDNQ